jgi:radical SAM protein with 4Fe4S-binding SPASM domain
MRVPAYWFWRQSELFTHLRQPQAEGECRSCGFYGSCRGGCMAAKFFTGLPPGGPDPSACAASVSRH